MWCPGFVYPPGWPLCPEYAAWLGLHHSSCQLAGNLYTDFEKPDSGRTSRQSSQLYIRTEPSMIYRNSSNQKALNYKNSFPKDCGIYSQGLKRQKTLDLSEMENFKKPSSRGSFDGSSMSAISGSQDCTNLRRSLAKVQEEFRKSNSLESAQLGMLKPTGSGQHIHFNQAKNPSAPQANVNNYLQPLQQDSQNLGRQIKVNPFNRVQDTQAKTQSNKDSFLMEQQSLLHNNLFNSWQAKPPSLNSQQRNQNTSTNSWERSSMIQPSIQNGAQSFGTRMSHRIQNGPTMMPLMNNSMPVPIMNNSMPVPMPKPIQFVQRKPPEPFYLVPLGKKPQENISLLPLVQNKTSDLRPKETGTWRFPPEVAPSTINVLNSRERAMPSSQSINPQQSRLNAEDKASETIHGNQPIQKPTLLSPERLKNSTCHFRTSDTHSTDNIQLKKAGMQQQLVTAMQRLDCKLPSISELRKIADAIKKIKDSRVQTSNQPMEKYKISASGDASLANEDVHRGSVTDNRSFKPSVHCSELLKQEDKLLKQEDKLLKQEDKLLKQEDKSVVKTEEFMDVSDEFYLANVQPIKLDATKNIDISAPSSTQLCPSSYYEEDHEVEENPIIKKQSEREKDFLLSDHILEKSLADVVVIQGVDISVLKDQKFISTNDPLESEVEVKGTSDKSKATDKDTVTRQPKILEEEMNFTNMTADGKSSPKSVQWTKELQKLEDTSHQKLCDQSINNEYKGDTWTKTLKADVRLAADPFSNGFATASDKYFATASDNDFHVKKDGMDEAIKVEIKSEECQQKMTFSDVKTKVEDVVLLKSEPETNTTEIPEEKIYSLIKNELKQVDDAEESITHNAFIKKEEIVFDEDIQMTGVYPHIREKSVSDRCPKGHFLKPMLASFNLRTGEIAVPCRRCKTIIYMQSKCSYLNFDVR